MIGPMMTKVVGNAQIFVVSQDTQTGKEYGMHIEVSGSNLELTNYGATGSVTLTGDAVSREIIDLDSY